MKKRYGFSLLILAFCFFLAAFRTVSPLTGGTIQFAAGEISAWQSGFVPAGSRVSYNLYAMANQNMIVSLGSANGSAILGIRDNQGTTYLGPESSSSYWSMILPHTGTYVIDVYGSGAASDPGTDFAFQVIIPPVQQQQNPWIPPMPIQPRPQLNGGSIQFGLGETSAVISGHVPANGQIRYDLYAAVNQNFIVMLSSATGTAVLGISDKSGNTYLPAAGTSTYWNMILPKTGTYIIDIVGRGQETDYTFQVIIPARISIPANSYSTSYSGTINSYSVVSYSAYAFAGQMMNIWLNSGATPTAFLRISGMGTGIVYVDNNSYQTGWYASLPATQDYLIEVVAKGSPASYQLTVDIR
ncbi:MAG: hypothetical protein AB9907_09970 [Flexilinea sp.]